MADSGMVQKLSSDSCMMNVSFSVSRLRTTTRIDTKKSGVVCGQKKSGRAGQHARQPAGAGSARGVGRGERRQ